MSSTKFSVHIRAALWAANDRRCFYCTEAISFRDLEIDHLIAEATPDGRLAAIKASLTLPDGFGINSPLNLVPTHHHCNARKSDGAFDEGSLRFYLKCWTDKQPRYQKELDRLQREAINERSLVALAGRIEKGFLGLDEAVRFLQESSGASEKKASEPIVATFGLSTLDLKETAVLGKDGAGYAQMCDRLEERLLARIQRDIPSVSARCEPSERNGESLSIRVAFWSLDVEHLDHLDLKPWGLLEFGFFSDVYPGRSWQELFPRAVIQTYQSVIRDEEDPHFGLKMCPKCGSERLKRAEAFDAPHDEMYYLIDCLQCGWSDWTQ